MPESALIDTNVLLRLSDREHPLRETSRKAMELLRLSGVEMCYTLQIAAEYWNVMTRPVSANGRGLSAAQAAGEMWAVERSLVFLADNESVFLHWRTLVERYDVHGKQVHDAKLAAAMLAHGVGRILTFNTADFERYDGVTAVHPASLGEAD